ncbi:MAG TPA: SRPBCC family protein [Thermoanaerobaculia bacterium]|nr:SRPBCC family protein [Thermoanaerobaculia bacterium]
MTTTTTIEPIRMNATVPLPPAEAFDLFTARIHTWWPLATHSVFQDNLAACVFEPRVGGRIVERSRDGEEHAWGEVLEYDPPQRFRVTWHPGGGPATEVEVTFTPADNGTFVELEHRGWEVFEQPEEARAGYANGWPFVFGECFPAAAAALAK